MKILTIRQPWAWLIIHGHKDIENRTWKTSYRGPLLIQASARPERNIAAIREDVLARFEITVPENLSLGGIVGMAYLSACDASSPSRWYAPGNFAWLLTRRTELPFAAYTGRLGLHAPDEDILGDCLSECARVMKREDWSSGGRP